MAKVNIKDIERVLKNLVNKIERQLFDATAQSLNSGITDSLEKTSVTGETLKGWSKTVPTKPIIGTRRMIVGRFTKGNAELIQRGLSVFPKYDLPRFITYKESPHLRDWAEKKLDNPPSRGLFVGGLRTRFGSKKNRWLDNGIDFLKTNLKAKGIEELNKIKI